MPPGKKSHVGIGHGPWSVPTGEIVTPQQSAVPVLSAALSPVLPTVSVGTPAYDPNLDQPTVGVVATLDRDNYASDAAAGAALVAAFNSMGAGTLRLKGNGSALDARAWNIGTSVLRPAGANRHIWGDHAVVNADHSVTAPIKIVGTGAKVMDLQSRDGCTFTNLDISGSVYDTAVGGGTGTLISGHNSDLVLRRVCLHDAPITGLQGYLDGSLLEDCELYGCGTFDFAGAGLRDPGVRAAIKMTNSPGVARALVTFRRVYAHDNPRHGFWLDCQGKGLLIEDCWVVNNAGKGAFLEISQGPVTIRGTLFRGNNQLRQAATGAITITSSKNITVEDCDFFDNFGANGNNALGSAVYVWNDTRASTTGSGCDFGWFINNVLIQHNRLHGQTIYKRTDVPDSAWTLLDNAA